MKSQRIKFFETKEGKVMEIESYYDEGKQKMLLIWLVAFSLCGLAIISQLFMDVNSELKLMIGIFAFFWLYFEYKILRAYRWRKNGIEKLIFTDETLYYGRLVSNRGFLKPYRKDLIGTLRKIEIPENNFFASMNDSYWIISGETLAFSYAGGLVSFGMRLTKAEVNLITKKIRSYFQEDTGNAI